MCHSVFEGGDVRYGYTTVPTYPRSALHCCDDVLHALHRSACAPKQTCHVQLSAASGMPICVRCHQAFASCIQRQTADHAWYAHVLAVCFLCLAQVVESRKLHGAYMLANCSLCVCSGQIGFLLCSKKGNSSVDPRIPKREPSAAPSKGYPALRYACPVPSVCTRCLHCNQQDHIQ